MRAIATTPLSQKTLPRAARQTRVRSVKPVVSQQAGNKASSAAAAIAVVVSATLPLLQVPGAHASIPQWQPVAVIAQADEEVAPSVVTEVVEAPAVEAAAEEAAPAEEAVPVEEAAPAAVDEATEEAVLKEEVTEVLEEEIPAVESEIAEIKDAEQEQVAEDVVDLVEEEASAADEALEKGVPPAPAVAKLLDTIQNQLANLKAQFSLPQ